MQMCIPCRTNMHQFCLGISCACNHQSQQIGSEPSLTSQDDSSSPDISEADVSEDDEPEETRGSLSGKSNTRRLKRDATLKDQQSTGRKRAARMYPLDAEADCEWKGKANCGGGKSPILGCHEGKQQARHHGPDKSVSNNEPGNVHRICHACHNRWHAANNATYDWNDTTVLPHKPTEQTKEEHALALINHLAYQGKKLKKIKD